MDFLKSAVAAAALALVPLAAGAAPIDLAGLGYETDALVDARDAVIDYDTLSGFLFAGDAFFELAVQGFDALDPATVAFALFPPGGPAADLFADAATAFGEDGDYLEYLFEGVTGLGAYAGFDGGAMLVQLGAAGSDLINGAIGLPGTVTITALREVAPIPLPAGAVLLLSGLAGLGAAARRRRAG